MNKSQKKKLNRERLFASTEHRLTFLESHTRYGLKAYKEPCRNKQVKQSNLIIFFEDSDLSGLSIQDCNLYGVPVA